MSSLEEGVETFVILPFPRYKALDQKSKKVDPPAELEPEPEASTSPEVEPPPIKQVDHQDVRLTYRSTQMKKLFHHIKAVLLQKFPTLMISSTMLWLKARKNFQMRKNFTSSFLNMEWDLM